MGRTKGHGIKEGGRGEGREQGICSVPITCSKHCFFSFAGLAAEVKWTQYQVSDSCSHWSRRNNRRLKAGWNSGIQQSTQIFEISLQKEKLTFRRELQI